MTSAKPARNLGVGLLLLLGVAVLFLVIVLILRNAGDRQATGHALLLLIAVVVGATGAGLLVRRWHR
jgi:hypothetical protein